MIPEPLPMPVELPEGFLEFHVRDTPPEAQLSPGVVREVTRALRKFEPVWPLGLQLADRPQAYEPLPESPLKAIYMSESVDIARRLTQLVLLDIALRAQAGDAVSVLTRVRAAFNLARAANAWPTLVATLKRIASTSLVLPFVERILAQVEFNDDQLRQLQSLLDGEANQQRLVQAMRTERAMAVGICDIAMNQPQSNSGVARVFLSEEERIDVEELLPRDVVHGARPQILRWMTRLAHMAGEPISAWPDTLEEIKRQSADGNPFAKLCVGAAIRITSYEVRSKAMLRCASAAVAVERFRRANHRWPNSFDEVTQAGFMREVPEDPFNGLPLRLKRTPLGLAVYSVGEDCRDDGGSLEIIKRGDWPRDAVFRLFNPAHRRRVPEPLPPPRPMQDVNRG